MIYRKTRMASLLLAFGVFFSISCSNLENTTSADTADSRLAALQSEIEDINREISGNPGNEELLSQKADLLYQYSQEIEMPANRQSVYLNIRDIADGFKARSNVQPDEIDALLVKAWQTELKSGITLLQKDQADRNESEISLIISHFENAITLMPDSIRTYNLLATTHYQHGNLTNAIETLEIANQKSDQDNSGLKEKLAYLYLESGELTEAELRYRKLVVDQPDNLLYKHGLANVLMLNNKHEEATDLLEELSKEYPTRYVYKESLATELYQVFKQRSASYIENGTIRDLSTDDKQALAGLLSDAHSIYESLQETLPTTEENLYMMATFYKKTSERLEKLSINETNNSFADLQNDFLEYSLPLWERLAKLKPDNLGYINNLYQVYISLEMQEEAEAIERTYNF